MIFTARFYRFLVKGSNRKRERKDHSRVLAKLRFRPWFLKRAVRKYYFVKSAMRKGHRLILLKKKPKQKKKKLQSLRLAYKYAFCKFLLVKRIPSVIISDRFEWFKLLLQ